MKKYLVEITVYFLLPAVLIAAVAEYSLRKIPNDYALKNELLTKKSTELEVLVLGASSILYGFNPNYTEIEAFNAAHVSQSSKYDRLIFNKFINQMPNLEYVIMSVDFWSFYGDIEESPEWWRVKYYNIHYGANLYRWKGRYNYELYFHDISTFRRAANGLLTLIGLRNDSHVTINDKGFAINYTMENRPSNWDNGEYEAMFHNSLVEEALKLKLTERNTQHVEDVILQCASRGIKVLLINAPLYHTYRENLNPMYLSNHKEFCKSFERNYSNVTYIDFTDDPRFSEDDFYNANHLNDKGGEKLTRILDGFMKSDTSQLMVESKQLEK